jgi:hypothetical protein
MFFNLAALLDDAGRWIGAHGWQAKTLYMAVVESLLVHRRSLMDFYFAPDGYEVDRRKDSTMFAADFCDEWAPERPTSFREEWGAISEEVMHMTYARPEVASDWPYAQMRDELAGLTRTFIDTADCRLHDYIKLQLEATACGNQRIGRALTPKVQADIAVDPRELTGFTPAEPVKSFETLGRRI